MGGRFFFFQAEDGIRDIGVTGVQTCALPISGKRNAGAAQDTIGSFSNSVCRARSGKLKSIRTTSKATTPICVRSKAALRRVLPSKTWQQLNGKKFFRRRSCRRTRATSSRRNFRRSIISLTIGSTFIRTAASAGSASGERRGENDEARMRNDEGMTKHE